ncbi:MAG: hypothetical protein D6748_14745 [Calditrichaeota bacterium]|nr:MAG: hypothetical protein D6748_14745 [Calditrichota bacterium]
MAVRLPSLDPAAPIAGGTPVACGVYLYRLNASPLEQNTPLNPPLRGENRGLSQTQSAAPLWGKVVLLR